MAEIFDEENMRHVLERYIPDGETLLAGIHAVAKEMEMREIFGNCKVGEDSIFPAEESGQDILVIKKKYAGCDIYLGMTQYSLIITECEKERYLYEFVDAEGAVEAHENGHELKSEILLSDIGKCVLLSDIKDCEIKNGMLGSKKCRINMKNGGYFKLMLPKLGGLGDGMPHYSEYKDAIIAGLLASSK